jgi:hypothetical protein
LLLPQVPKAPVLVHSWNCLRSYQSSRVFATSVDTNVDIRHIPICQTNIEIYRVDQPLIEHLSFQGKPNLMGGLCCFCCPKKT